MAVAVKTCKSDNDPTRTDQLLKEAGLCYFYSLICLFGMPNWEPDGFRRVPGCPHQNWRESSTRTSRRWNQMERGTEGSCGGQAELVESC